jgi:hypothetical protein
MPGGGRIQQRLRNDISISGAPMKYLPVRVEEIAGATTTQRAARALWVAGQ